MRKLYLLGTIILVHLLVGLTAHAQSVTIFPFSSQWKYLDNGSDQGTAWRTTSFNDGTWLADTGTFGYGDPGWVTKCLNACGTVSCAPSCGTKYITTYFRKTITMADVSMFDSVQFSIMRDDGFILYVNGVEVASDNMPAHTLTPPTSGISYQTKAPNAIGGADEYTPIIRNVPISAFQNGTNVIALELHQNDGSSSDLTFNMQAKAYARSILMPYGSIWKYYVGSDLGTAWRASFYSDGSWTLSTGGHMGFGETWTTTCIPAGPSGCTAGCIPGGSCTKYPTSYFRRILSIPDPTLYDSVRFSVFRDDGIVMYVNGNEVWRDNMPAAPTVINYNTTAPNNINGTTGQYAEQQAVVRALPISAFATGDNVIAIELHQNSATSSDADMNVQVAGVVHVVPTLVRGPYLQMGSDTAFTVRWRTNVACNSKLELGTSTGNYNIVLDDAAMVTEHEMRVRGLSPNTKYYYRFGTSLEVLQGDTTNFCVTAPASGTSRRVTLAAYGDCGQNSNGYQTGALSAYRAYLSSIGLKAADMMLLVGDNAYNSGTDNEYQTGFFNAYQGNILKNHMLFPAPGNHDYYASGTGQNDKNVPYYSIFSMPAAGQCGGVPSGTEAYYSYNWGDVHILSLDSYGRENAGTTRLYDTAGAQVQWIKADLAANTKKWVIAYWHHPPYTMGSHTSDGEGELVSIRENFIRILERYGVDMIICGHSHDYERSYLMKGHYGNEASFNVAAHAVDNSSAKYDGSANSCPYTTTSGQVNHGTVYVVAGSSGASGGVQGGYPHNAMPFSINDGGMFFVDINNNRLDAKFIRKDGTIWDKFTIMKDVKVKDTVEVLHGSSVDLSASWEGNYAWAPGVTTRTVTVTPTQDSLVEVKDDMSATCLTDKHYVDLLCTMPDITSMPADIIREGCDNMVTYAIADTGRPAPAITYAFTGATVASGNGTGSGSLFSVGVTTVTLTATNECGSTGKSFTVTIKPLPVVYNMTGGGGYCPGGTGVEVGLANTQTGMTYQLYDGATAIGAPRAGTGGPISFGTLSVVATYSVLATDDATSCTNRMANTKQVFIYTSPTAQTVTGGGNYCAGSGGSPIGLGNTQADVNYQLYDGATAIGAPRAGTGSAITFGTFTTTSTYSVVATDIITTCVNDMSGSATIGIDPLPAVYNVTGGGNYCMGGAGMPVGLDNSETGVNYYLYDGSIAVRGPEAGTGSAIGFGDLTNGTTYTVVATNATTGCTDGMNGSATVIIDPLPVVYTMSAGGNYCSGGTGVPLTLSGSETGVDYQLYHGTAATGSGVAGTGTVLDMGTQLAAGTYTVLATNTTTNCTNSMAGASTIGIYGLPTLYAITGGGSYCAGGTGVAVGLGGSSAGIEYQLYNGTTAIGTPEIGTGLPLTFGAQTDAGSYNVIATDLTTSCANTMSGVAAITVTPVAVPTATVAIFPTDTVCEGTTVFFNALAENGGATPGYEWKVNGTTVPATLATYSYVPANGDVVSVTLHSSLPCVTGSTVTVDTAIVVKPNVMPSATLAVTSDSVCNGTPVSFSVTSVNGGSAPVYTWLKNSVIAATGLTAYSFTPVDGDAVVVSMASNAPCRLADNVYSNLVSMQVDDSYIPAVTISAIPGQNIAQGQPVTFSAHVAGGGPIPTYKWAINSQVLAGATNATFTTAELFDKDTVMCMVKGSGLCGLDGFNAIVMNVVSSGVGTTGKAGTISVIPNPTNGEVTIEGMTGMESAGAVTITVTNVLGQEVCRKNTTATAGRISERISLGSHLADGTYLLTVGNVAGRQVFHIILKR
ncbi:hypothetical protein GCM10023093_02690 [Nemorincola caseinilytica]|uniref:Ig-like domain-containing protein n=1 Tax=Nemorincola caseinilytica TaxID=2054315 RepID=A0ABP8N754_9BACT